MQLRERLDHIHRELDGLAAQAAREREERLRGLQLAARSLRQAESTGQWVQILADAAAPLARSVCFFRIEGDEARCEAARGMEPVAGAVALSGAPALRQAVETKETVVCLFAPSQLSAAVTGDAVTRRRAHLFPLVGKTRVLGVLLALDDGGPDAHALEVLLSLGSAALELRETKSQTLIGLAAPAPAQVPGPAATLPRTAAQFARETVARWVLEFDAQIRAGRATGDLYGALQGPVDDARREYQAQYPNAPDCLHAEMVARLALGDAQRLGAAYPGSLDRGARA